MAFKEDQQQLVVSGGEDSVLNVVHIQTANRIARFDHHRGPVTCVAINNRQDVLLSGTLELFTTRLRLRKQINAQWRNYVNLC